MSPARGTTHVRTASDASQPPPSVGWPRMRCARPITSGWPSPPPSVLARARCTSPSSSTSNHDGCLAGSDPPPWMPRRRQRCYTWPCTAGDRRGARSVSIIPTRAAPPPHWPSRHCCDQGGITFATEVRAYAWAAPSLRPYSQPSAMRALVRRLDPSELRVCRNVASATQAARKPWLHQSRRVRSVSTVCPIHT